MRCMNASLVSLPVIIELRGTWRSGINSLLIRFKPMTCALPMYLIRFKPLTRALPKYHKCLHDEIQTHDLVLPKDQGAPYNVWTQSSHEYVCAIYNEKRQTQQTKNENVTLKSSNMPSKSRPLISAFQYLYSTMLENPAALNIPLWLPVIVIQMYIYKTSQFPFLL